jgi:hypothetical protein
MVFGPVARQSIMAVGCGKGKLLTSHLTAARKHRETGKGME